MKPSGLRCLHVACLLLPITGSPLAGQNPELLSFFLPRGVAGP
jgi:hypothetical protein